jgi:AcrR family transcriptional regulator
MGAKGDNRRALIVDAALELFSTAGYEGVTTRAIASRAGITESALFRYFRTKQELYAVVLKERSPDTLPPASMTHAGGFEHCFRREVKAFLDRIWEHRASVRVSVIGMLCGKAEPGAEPPGEDVRLAMLSAMEAGAGAGEMRAELAEQAALVTASAVVGFLLRVFTCPAAEMETAGAWDSQRDTFLEALCAMLLPMIILEPAEEPTVCATA